MGEFQVHPLADAYPMLSSDELRDLADDIAANGQQFPIILDASGRVVDGRNRLAACRLAGVEPRCETVDLATDVDVAAYVQAVNNRRRHLSSGQVAAADALLMSARGQRANGRWVRGSLSQDLGKAEREAMRKAGLVADHRHELLAEVVAGRLSLDAAWCDAVYARNHADDYQPEPPSADMERFLEMTSRLADSLAANRNRTPRPAGQPRTRSYPDELAARTRAARDAAWALRDLIDDERWDYMWSLDLRPRMINDLHDAHQLLGGVINALPPGTVEAWEAARERRAQRTPDEVAQDLRNLAANLAARRFAVHPGEEVAG